MLLPSEKGDQLNEAEGELLFSSFYRASVSKTLNNDTLTVEGSGRYKVLPQTGTTDNLTAITLSSENVDGALIQVRPERANDVITLVHGGNLHLLNGVNVQLTTIWSTIWLRHYGGSVWAQEGPLSYVP